MKHEEEMTEEDACDCGCDDDCDCGCDDEMSCEELSESNNLLINAVIELLIKKKLITRDEFEKTLDELQSEEDKDDKEE